MYARNLQRTSENLEFPLDLEMFGECLDNLGGSTAEASLGRFGTSWGVLDVLGRFARRTGAHGAPLVLQGLATMVSTSGEVSCPRTSLNPVVSTSHHALRPQCVGMRTITHISQPCVE